MQYFVCRLISRYLDNRLNVSTSSRRRVSSSLPRVRRLYQWVPISRPSVLRRALSLISTLRPVLIASSLNFEPQKSTPSVGLKPKYNHVSADLQSVPLGTSQKYMSARAVSFVVECDNNIVVVVFGATSFGPCSGPRSSTSLSRRSAKTQEKNGCFGSTSAA